MELCHPRSNFDDYLLKRQYASSLHMDIFHSTKALELEELLILAGFFDLLASHVNALWFAK